MSSSRARHPSVGPMDAHNHIGLLEGSTSFGDLQK